MKHLLIFLSILLLSSPLFGQETGVLYQYETSSGWEWKTFGDGKEIKLYPPKNKLINYETPTHSHHFNPSSFFSSVSSIKGNWCFISI